MPTETDFDAGMAVAEKALEPLIRRMSPKQIEGAVVLMTWWRQHLMTAGHKRLWRLVKAHLLQQ